MLESDGLKIALVFLVFILVLRLLLMGWQKVAVKRTGKRFSFLLTKFSLKGDIDWQDVKYSLLVIIDSLITLVILIWIFNKIF
jgi:hypothetical protein